MSRAPHTMTATAAQEEKCILAATRGMTARRIARDVLDGALDTTQVRKILYAAADRIRRESAGIVAARWMRQDEILSRLIESWYARLLRDGFDRDVATALLKALERQSRLHGADAKPNLGPDEWLAEKTDAEYVEMIRRMGLRVPDDILEPSRN